MGAKFQKFYVKFIFIWKIVWSANATNQFTKLFVSKAANQLTKPLVAMYGKSTLHKVGSSSDYMYLEVQFTPCRLLSATLDFGIFDYLQSLSTLVWINFNIALAFGMLSNHAM